MARWRVTAKCYLNALQFGEKTEWVREETNRDTGRMFRRTFVVPLFIDPEDPSCINRTTGLCVVATEGSELPGDIIILSPPTPDMEPLDEEARQITDSWKSKWKSPIDSLPVQIGENFGEQLLAALTAQLNSASATQGKPTVSSSEVAELKAMIAEQQRQINALLAGSGPAIPSTPGIPDEDHLEDIDVDTPPAPPPVTAPRSARRT